MTAAERGGPASAVATATVGAIARQLPALARSLASVARMLRPGSALLLLSSGLAPVLLSIGWLVSDALQPVTYSPVRQTVSVLAGYSATDRWIVTAALYAIGSCYLLTAVGLSAVGRPARIGLAVAGIAAFGIALSPEPAEGTIPRHLVWTVIGAIALAVWPALVARRDVSPSHILSLRTSAVATMVSLALLGWTALETQRGAMLGLAERLSCSLQLCWPFAVAFGLWRRDGLRAVRGRPATVPRRR